MSEIADLSHTSQLAVFVRSVPSNFDITEEFASLFCVKYIGVDLLEAIQQVFRDFDLLLANAVQGSNEFSYGDVVYYSPKRWLSRGTMTLLPLKKIESKFYDKQVKRNSRVE